MASPLMLALTATAALVAAPALACEGQGCWGMAPVYEANPGYPGPDYSQFPGFDQGGPDGPGGPEAPQGAEDGFAGPSYEPGSAAPYVGPIEGYPNAIHSGVVPGWSGGRGYAYGEDEQQAGPYGPPPAPAYGGGYQNGGYQGGGYQGGGYQNGGYQGGGFAGGAYGGQWQGAPGYGMAPRPEGWDRRQEWRGQGQPYPMDGQEHAYGYAGRGATMPPAPYQGYAHDGYERRWRSPPSMDGYREHGYTAGSRDEYDYDSGWVENTGPTMTYRNGWSSQRPYGAPSYGPPPCQQCGPEAN